MCWKLNTKVRTWNFTELVSVGLEGRSEVSYGCFRIEVDCFDDLCYSRICAVGSLIIVWSEEVVSFLLVTEKEVDHALVSDKFSKDGVRVEFDVRAKCFT